MYEKVFAAPFFDLRHQLNKINIDIKINITYAMVKQIAPTTATNTRGISEIAITTGNAIRHKAI